MFKIRNRVWRAQPLLVLVLAATLTIGSAYKVSDFKESILKPSHPSGYYNVATGDETIGEILCFGDINGDQYTDYVGTPDRNTPTLYIYFWSQFQSSFVRNPFDISDEIFDQDTDTVQEVMLADLTNDGIEEIILTYSTQSANTSGMTYSTIVFEVSNCDGYKCKYTYLPAKGDQMTGMTTTPLLINFDGRDSPQFLTFENNNRYVYTKTTTGISLNLKKKNFTEYLNDQHKPTSFNKVTKHYSSNIDFSGDCHSDLVVLSSNSQGKSVLEFYEKQANSKMNHVRDLQFVHKVRFYTFVDVDSSGTIDIALIMEDKDGHDKIHIIKNARSEPSTLCSHAGEFPFRVEDIRQISIGSRLASNSIINFGDINSDSLPDMLVIVTSSDFRKAVLMMNAGKGYFKQAGQLNADQISEVKNPEQAAFFDLAEDGKLDILVMGEEVKDSDGRTAITRTAIMNNVKEDTLFIKILPLSQDSAYSIGSTRLSAAFGISIQWVITELSGRKKIEILPQRSQWNHGSLQLPFASGGLGRTNNYVEDLTIGYPGQGQKQGWSPIIPNSKLLVYKDNGQWKLQTLLSNNQRVNQVIIVSIVILLALGFVIFFLNYKEKQEDRKDHYNFIQLIR